MTMIEKWAEAIKKHEGWFEGSRSFRNKNPGNFRCSSLVMGELGAIRCDDNFAVFPDYETGWKALVQFLTYAADGSLRSYKPEMTLYEFYTVYAPSTDGNYPRGYAEAVAKDMGVSPETKIGTFLGNPISKGSVHTRYGHVNQVFIKVGDVVKIGDKIATNGTGNGQWPAHCHRDHPKNIPKKADGTPDYTFYNIGWTQQQTEDTFADPRPYPKALGPGFSHLGYDWCEIATYTGGKAYHPGLDENGIGGGDADYDAPVYAVASGVVKYVYAGSGTNNGWGRLIVVEESINQEETMLPEFSKAVGDVIGKDLGANINEGEQKDSIPKLKAVKDKLEAFDDISDKLTVALDEVERMKIVVREYADKAGVCEPALAKCSVSLEEMTTARDESDRKIISLEEKVDTQAKNFESAVAENGRLSDEIRRINALLSAEVKIMTWGDIFALIQKKFKNE